jgi:hypothetical protein
MVITNSTNTQALFTEEAKCVMHQCMTPSGFLASPKAHDNYQRIWSRDAAIAGLTSLVCNDDEGIDCFVRSVLSLGAYQAEHGQLPSNVGLSKNDAISFGSLSGRVDATTWWIISACMILQKDGQYADELIPKIRKALGVLEVWQFNNRGFIYTPLGGNWADEYISQGYVLYDQLLWLWALRAAGIVLQDTSNNERAIALEDRIIRNFSFRLPPHELHYHLTAYQKVYQPNALLWASSFGPAGYDCRWDMPAHALLLLLGLFDDVDALDELLMQWSEKYGSGLLPVFDPVIMPDDPEWFLLRENYRYQFKNHPHHFHNGGSWPVWIGLLGLGFTLNGRSDVAHKLMMQLQKNMKNATSRERFAEYWNPKTGVPGGVMPLCFSASGYLMLSTEIEDISTLKNNLLC